MTHDDVVLFACGGGARASLTEVSGSAGDNAIILDATTQSTVRLVPDEVTYGCRGDSELGAALIRDHAEDIGSLMDGKRIVIVFAVFGGGAGTGMLPEVARIARGRGCKVVSIVGLPMLYEENRRRRAIEALPVVKGCSDRILILDYEALNRMYPDVNIYHVYRRVSSTVMFTLSNLAQMMEGPFFSTFPEKVYTFAYVTDLIPSKAVARARETSMFKSDPSFGKTIVTVSGGFGQAQTESIYDTVVSMTGIIPDIVKREDREDTKVLVFLPVQDF